jgi:dihydroneopterin aldolase
MKTAISIKGLQAFAFHGLFPEERQLGQKFMLDIDGELSEGTTHQDDSLLSAVRYDEIVSETFEAATSSRFQTLEALAEAIGRMLLRRFPALQQVDVAVAKLSPPIAQTIQSATVRIRLSRLDMSDHSQTVNP